MTIKKFIEELSKYPEDIDLKDVRIRLAVEKEIGYKRIKSVYLGGYRIVGGATPFGSNSVVLERFPNLGDVAKSLLANLKLPRKERAMKVKLKGTSGAPFDVIEVYPETYNGEPTIPFVQYFCDEEGTIYKDELLEFVTDGRLQTTATIKGWVAVDDFDNAYIYHSKPTQRCKEFCDTGDFVVDWVCDTKYPNGKRCYVIDKDLFPDLTPESEPLKVRILITSM